MRKEEVQAEDQEHQEQEKEEKQEKIMPYKIRKSRTFKSKYEIRSASGRLFATDLTKRQAQKTKGIANRYERCVKKVKKKGKVRSPHAVCRKAVTGKRK